MTVFENLLPCREKKKRRKKIRIWNTKTAKFFKVESLCVPYLIIKKEREREGEREMRGENEVVIVPAD